MKSREKCFMTLKNWQINIYLYIYCTWFVMITFCNWILFNEKKKKMRKRKEFLLLNKTKKIKIQIDQKFLHLKPDHFFFVFVFWEKKKCIIYQCFVYFSVRKWYQFRITINFSERNDCLLNYCHLSTISI